MKYMKRIKIFLLGLFAFCSLNAQDFDNVTITSQKVSDNIYMLVGMGGNIGVFTGEEGTLMIDGQFAQLSTKIKNAILELSDKPVHYLVNTHWHGDHTGSNENFANEGAVIVSHQNVRKRMSTDQRRPFRGTTPASPKAALPVITFDENMQLHFNGESIQLIHHHTAHTDGDAFIYFPLANVLHMGDCFFNYLFPYVDTASGGHPDGAIKAVEAALLLADEKTKIIPGHGVLANKDDLQQYLTMYLTIRDRIKEALEDGALIDEALINKVAEGFESWEWGFIDAEKFVKMMYSAYAD